MGRHRVRMRIHACWTGQARVTREYVHACTISVFLRRLPIREHPVRGLAHCTVDTLAIPPRHRM
eukprot:901390-Pyramimonas_sp.AAC.1